MSDPLAQPPDDAPLFNQPPRDPKLPAIGGTRAAAFNQAAEKIPSWHQRILAAIENAGDDGCTLFELVARFGVRDNVISGRISELLKDMKIAWNQQTRRHPKSGCPCRVYVRDRRFG
jgi:hypothetical protein